ncbi:hypothetical protein AAF712_011606 [Marasmius tenuissimus]|uniref:ATPase inhibitor, mitochondrial n=1 Tax=Marasmius tenuissimus TaxID=585030 RepID=A0ABR2ZK52_9AGAR
MLAARITAARRLPQVALIPKRFSSSVRDGSVAQSKGFKDKESAHENEYIRKQEQLELQKLKAQIEQQKLEIQKLQREAESVKKD